MMKTSRRAISHSIVVATVLLGGVACDVAQNPGEEPPRTISASQELQLANGASLWPSLIPVCFTYNSAVWNDGNWTTFRANLQTWIPNQLGRHVGLTFSGWGQCSGSTSGKITVKYTKGDTVHSNSGLGYSASGATVVDFHDDAVVSNPAWQESKALHEFMHALGFIHEWETSANTTNDCGLASYGTTGQRYGTPYDHGSLLNATYCAGLDDMHDPSPWDLIGMQRAYGRKLTGSIVGPNNKCLVMDSAGIGDSPITAYDCAVASWTRWKYTAQNEIATTSSYSYGNMDAEGGVAAPHTRVVNWVANGTAAQKWYLENVQIVGMGGFCLGAEGGNVVAGQRLALAYCVDGGAWSQNWTIRMTSLSGQDRFQLVAANGSLCATVGASDSLTLQTCNSSSTAQLFKWNANQQISSELTSRCLDVYYGAPQAGTIVQPYYCWTSPTDYNIWAQTWYVRGHIKGLGGYCLNSVLASPTNNSAMELQSCSSSTVWDFYPYIGQ
jgi:hypothetical protein